MAFEHAQEPSDLGFAIALGRIQEERSRIANALSEGRYEDAISIGGELFQEINDLRERNPPRPRMVPLLIQATGILTDAATAYLAIGEPQTARSLLNQATHTARSVQRLAKPLASSISLCAHGRRTYTGYCMKIPPCPPD